MCPLVTNTKLSNFSVEADWGRHGLRSWFSKRVLQLYNSYSERCLIREFESLKAKLKLELEEEEENVLLKAILCEGRNIWWTAVHSN